MIRYYTLLEEDKLRPNVPSGSMGFWRGVEGSPSDKVGQEGDGVFNPNF